MNFVIFLIFFKFSLKGSIFFPIKDSPLNPGFGIEVGKNFSLNDNRWGFSLDVKSMNSKESSEVKFSIVSGGAFFSFFFLDNVEAGVALLYSFLNLRKGKWSESGFTGGSRIFGRFLFKNSPLFIESQVDFVKGKNRDLWLFGVSFGIQ